MKIAHHNVGKQVEPPMKEVLTARDHHDRELLRASPIEHRSQRNDIVVLAVDHQRVGRHGFRKKPVYGRPYEHEAFGREALCDPRLNKAAEGKSREHHWKIIKPLFEISGDGKHVLCFPVPFVILAARGAYAAKIRPYRDILQREESLRERRYYLIVLGAALYRVRVSNKGDPASSAPGVVDIGLDLARGSIDHDPRKRRRGHGTNVDRRDRKSTRLNSSHLGISYAVFCF